MSMNNQILELILAHGGKILLCTHPGCNKKAKHEWRDYDLRLCDKHNKEFTNDIKKILREEE